MSGLTTEQEQRIREQARAARRASRTLPTLSSGQKNKALHAMAKEIRTRVEQIKQANDKDIAAAHENGLSEAMIDRLKLDDKRIEGICLALEEVAALPDPVGETGNTWVRPNGLRVGKMRIPLGVVAMIYESRPNVTADAAALCFKAGNACVLRGGKEAFESSHALAAALKTALLSCDLDPEAVQLIETTEREGIDVLLTLEDDIDLVIPRGGEGLIRAVAEKSRIPVLKHYKGVCHVYVDAAADIDRAVDIVENAKVQRPSVCNAAETVLIHKDIADVAVQKIAERLLADGVEIRGCAQTVELLGDQVTAATEEDWPAEYLDLVIAMKIVDDFDAAIDHIAQYSSDHTEAIITQDYNTACRFVAAIQSSTVVVNASTRFADGGELGLGAEIGISTSKLHAYGPMGAKELTTEKFVVFGNGQIRQ